MHQNQKNIKSIEETSNEAKMVYGKIKDQREKLKKKQKGIRNINNLKGFETVKTQKRQRK